MSRRAFLLGAAGAAAVAGTGVALGRSRANTVLTAMRFSDYPFTLGVASGEPVHNGTSDHVVLWTRLAPDPLNGRRDAAERR